MTPTGCPKSQFGAGIGGDGDGPGDGADEHRGDEDEGGHGADAGACETCGPGGKIRPCRSLGGEECSASRDEWHAEGTKRG